MVLKEIHTNLHVCATTCSQIAHKAAYGGNGMVDMFAGSGLINETASRLGYECWCLFGSLIISSFMDGLHMGKSMVHDNDDMIRHGQDQRRLWAA